MIADGYLRLFLFLAALFVLIKPLGWYIARIYAGEPAWLNQLGAPLERAIYRVCARRQLL